MNGWTQERRAKQSEMIRSWQPWLHSTGARTPEGKAKVARNPWRGGHRDKMREMIRLVNEEIRMAQRLVGSLQNESKG